MIFTITGDATDIDFAGYPAGLISGFSEIRMFPLRYCPVIQTKHQHSVFQSRRFLACFLSSQTSGLSWFPVSGRISDSNLWPDFRNNKVGFSGKISDASLIISVVTPERFIPDPSESGSDPNFLNMLEHFKKMPFNQSIWRFNKLLSL